MIECKTVDQIPQGAHVGVILQKDAELPGQPPCQTYLAFANVGDFRIWESQSLQDGSVRRGTYRAAHHGAGLAVAETAQPHAFV